MCYHGDGVAHYICIISVSHYFFIHFFFSSISHDHPRKESLMCYVFCKSKSVVRRFENETRSGMMMANDCLVLGGGKMMRQGVTRTRASQKKYFFKYENKKLEININIIMWHVSQDFSCQFRSFHEQIIANVPRHVKNTSGHFPP